MRRVDFHPQARRELRESAAYYRRKGPGLSDSFLNAAGKSRHRIAQHPYLGAKIHGEYRRVLLRRFPYALIYTIMPSGILIVSVAHFSRDPLYWLGRE